MGARQKYNRDMYADLCYHLREDLVSKRNLTPNLTVAELCMIYQEILYVDRIPDSSMEQALKHLGIKPCPKRDRKIVVGEMYRMRQTFIGLCTDHKKLVRRIKAIEKHLGIEPPPTDATKAEEETKN